MKKFNEDFLDNDFADDEEYLYDDEDFENESEQLDDIFDEDDIAPEAGSGVDVFSGFIIDDPLDYDEQGDGERESEIVGNNYSYTGTDRRALQSVDNDSSASLTGVEGDLNNAMKAFPKQDTSVEDDLIDTVAMVPPAMPLLQSPAFSQLEPANPIILDANTMIEGKIIKKGSVIRVLRNGQ